MADLPPDADLEAYAYDLPPELIAQRPAPRRDGARLMVLAGDAAPAHRLFGELGALLPPGCLLVCNDTRVVPARLTAHKETGGALELLRVPVADGSPEELRAMVRGRLRRPGQVVSLPGGVRARFLERLDDGVARFTVPPGTDVDALFEAHATLPLPPYIERSGGPDEDDRQRYQTIFATTPGAVAAPTAGLHFTPDVIEDLAARGVALATVTLHVGPGTFLPVRARDVRVHRVAGEPVHVSASTAEAVAAARGAGRPVVAVGTTVARALEGAARRAAPGELLATGAATEDLVIRPGHRFAVVDGLITNFHLPRSSLLLLVAALAGRERILHAYAEAVASGYRFYSYGDAMLILPRPAP